MEKCVIIKEINVIYTIEILKNTDEIEMSDVRCKRLCCTFAISDIPLDKSFPPFLVQAWRILGIRFLEENHFIYILLNTFYTLYRRWGL